MITVETLDSGLARDGSQRHRVEQETSSPRLIVVLECRRPTVLGCRLMLDQLDEVVVARSMTGRIRRDHRSARILVGDFQVSRQHLAIRRTGAGWRIRDLGSKNGTAVNGALVDSALLSDGDLIEAGGAMLLFLEDGLAGDASDRELASPAGPRAFQTLNVQLEQRIQQILKVAPAPVPILVRGETGTGKELMARAIHEVSGRRGAFVPVNCGALPRDLVEAELFGYRRGAFSGAREDREGLVRRAHGGTLFLDEIAELPLDSQAALLRVVQEGEVRPVGASDAVHVDVRVVAATHQDLQQRIADSRFRQDLYGRIAGFEISLPALRHRREDLGMLIAAILSTACPEPERITLAKAAARALFRYPWPHNVRELEHVVRAALGLCDGDEIRLEHLPQAVRDTRLPVDSSFSSADRLLRDQLIVLLREQGGNVSAVGRAMDRAPIQIRRWCRRLQIDLAQFRH